MKAEHKSNINNKLEQNHEEGSTVFTPDFSVAQEPASESE